MNINQLIIKIKKLFQNKKLLFSTGIASIIIVILIIKISSADGKELQTDSLSISSSDIMPVTELHSDKAAASVRKISPIPTEAEKSHLAFYDKFPMYNSSWDYFKGFVLSEEWIEGKPYYQLLNKNKDVKLLVDSSMEKAVIYHASKSMEIKLSIFLTGTSAHSTMDVLDLTGDGKDELVILYQSGGTGVWQTEYDIIDLSTMTKYKIEDYLYQLSSYVTVEPIAATKDHVITCRITDKSGKVSYGTVAGGTSDLSKYSYKPSDYSSFYHIEVNTQKQRLDVSTSIVMDDYGNCHLGSISSYLIYNEKKNCFVLSENYNVDIFEKAEYIEKADKIASDTTNNYESILINLKDKNSSLNKEQNNLIQKIIDYNKIYSCYYVNILTDDYDDNGKPDYFFLFTKTDPLKLHTLEYCADIWYGDEKGVQRIAEWERIAPNTYGTVELADKKYFRYDLQYVTDRTTVLLAVKNHKCTLSFKALGDAKFEKGSSDFTVNVGCYDMLHDKNMDLTLGHTWKNYYFFVDAKGFHEYGAKKVTKTQFLKYNKADKLLQLLKNKYEKEGAKVSFHFILRRNGLLHINISSDSKDNINYYYETYQINNRNGLDLYDSGDGSYVTAIDEKIAVY